MTAGKLDRDRDIAEAVFQRANLMSLARGEGGVVAGIVTAEDGNVFVCGDRAHPDFLRSLTEAMCAWIDAEGEEI